MNKDIAEQLAEVNVFLTWSGEWLGFAITAAVRSGRRAGVVLIPLKEAREAARMVEVAHLNVCRSIASRPDGCACPQWWVGFVMLVIPNSWEHALVQFSIIITHAVPWHQTEHKRNL